MYQVYPDFLPPWRVILKKRPVHIFLGRTLVPCINEASQCSNGGPDCKKEYGYIGTRSQTISGKMCLKWDGKSHNYCRNPDKNSKGPWCIHKKPEWEWDYCFPDCPGKKVATMQYNAHYCLISLHNIFCVQLNKSGGIHHSLGIVVGGVYFILKSLNNNTKKPD